MTDTVEQVVLDATKAWLQPVCTNPKLDDKLLSRPPFRYLFDIVLNINQNKGIINGLFTNDELHMDFNEKGPASAKIKAEFLNKLISFVNLASQDGRVDVSVKSILTGKDATKTNKLLQAFGKIAQTQQHSPGLIHSVNRASSATSTLRKDVTEKPATPPPPPPAQQPTSTPPPPPKPAVVSPPTPPRPADNPPAPPPVPRPNSAAAESVVRPPPQLAKEISSSSASPRPVDTAAPAKSNVNEKRAADIPPETPEHASAIKTAPPSQQSTHKPSALLPEPQVSQEKQRTTALSPSPVPATTKPLIHTAPEVVKTSPVHQQTAAGPVSQQPKPASKPVIVQQQQPPTPMPQPPPVLTRDDEPFQQQLRPSKISSPPSTSPNRLSANSPLPGEAINDFVRPMSRSGAITARARPPTRQAAPPPKVPQPRVVGEAPAGSDDSSATPATNNFIVVERRGTASSAASKNVVTGIVEDNEEDDDNSSYMVKTAAPASADFSGVRESTVSNPTSIPSSVPAGHLVDSLKQAKEAFDSASSRPGGVGLGSKPGAEGDDAKLGMQVETLWRNVQLLTQKIGQLNSLTDYYEEDFDAMMKEAVTCQNACTALEQKSENMRSEAPRQLQPLRDELDSLRRQIEQENSLIENLTVENMRMQDSLEACLRDMVA